MLSFYVIMLLCLSFSVDAKRCQKDEDSICGIKGFSKSTFNECCRKFTCTELKDGEGYSFCMEKNATLIAKGESCKGHRANCEEGLICERKGKTCVKPVKLGEDCSKESPCEKELRCKKKTGKCVERKEKGELGEDCSKVSPCGKGLRCKKKTGKCVAKKEKGKKN